MPVLEYAQKHIRHPDSPNINFKYIGDSSYPPLSTSYSIKQKLKYHLETIEEYEKFVQNVEEIIKELQDESRGEKY